ncbi:MAG TPA: DUF1579 family protein [Capsulimonadaceae bacterium]|nr:DUF1579 family protein [Capsulimonadaceae bacterium]
MRSIQPAPTRVIRSARGASPLSPFARVAHFAVAVLFGLVVSGTAPAFAGQDPVHERGSQKSHAKAAASQGLDESAVKKMMDSGAASEAMHVKILGQLAGDWYYKAAVWAVPGADPRWVSGTATNQMVMENRYLSSKIGGSLDFGGQQVLVTAQGFLGYDNVKNPSPPSGWIPSPPAWRPAPGITTKKTTPSRRRASLRTRSPGAKNDSGPNFSFSTSTITSAQFSSQASRAKKQS